MSGSMWRCLAVWAGGSAALGALGAWLARAAAAGAPLGDDGPAPQFDDLLVTGCAAVALVGCAWLWLAASLTILETMRGRAARGRGLPAPLRRLVLAACGAGLAAGLVAPAHATPGEVHTDHGSAAALAGLPLPDRAAALPGPASVATGPLHRTARPARSIVVRPGDTLWDLAATYLHDAARWPEIYALNRAVIGHDPSLIHPTTRLRLPADRPEETP